MSENTPLRLEIKGDQIKAFVAEAIFHQMDETTRQALIKEALQHLMEKKKDHYGSRSNPSPVEEAYHRAVETVAMEMIKELVKTEFKDQVEVVVREAITKVFVESKDKMVEAMAESMKRVMYALQEDLR